LLKSADEADRESSRAVLHHFSNTSPGRGVNANIRWRWRCRHSTQREKMLSFFLEWLASDKRRNFAEGATNEYLQLRGA